MVYEQVLKKSQGGALARSFHTFERLEEGMLIGHDGQKEYRADASDVILFPREECLVGQSLFHFFYRLHRVYTGGKVASEYEGQNKKTEN